MGKLKKYVYTKIEGRFLFIVGIILGLIYGFWFGGGFK